MALRESTTIIFGMLNDLVQSNGVTTSELSHKYSIAGNTTRKYINILEDMGVPIYEDKQRYFVDGDYSIPMSLTIPESELLMMVLERSLTETSLQWEVTQNLINKIVTKLPSTISDKLFAKLRNQDSQLQSSKWFMMLAIAKSKQLEVDLDYHPLHRESYTHWRIRPFRFVANPQSDGFYVQCEGTQDRVNYVPLSLKFDRIIDVKVTENRFRTIDIARFSSFEGNAWGVWHSDRDPQRVVLRFEPRHYDRLIESIWHSSQTIWVDNKSGYVTFSVYVSEPDEMIPWIRSWGSGVVVEEPDSLRKRIIKTLMRQIQHYGINLQIQDNTSTFDYLWAKYDPKTGDYHLLTYHLLDVGAVAKVMLQYFTSKKIIAWLSEILYLEQDKLINLLTFLVALHDIGKATPAFQSKVKPLFTELAPHLQEQVVSQPHGTLSTIILKTWLQNYGLSSQQAIPLASAIGGHHGTWITSSDIRNARGAVGHEHWKVIQDSIIQEIQSITNVNQIEFHLDTLQFNVLVTFLSGFLSVCDWIGSNDTYFAFNSVLSDYQEYYEAALLQAENAISDLGFNGWEVDHAFPHFKNIFNLKPNDLQQSAIQLVGNPQLPPRLILVEYLTGGGKTELALYLSDVLINLFELGGFYIAMPTQATSNQMFERVYDFLLSRYNNRSVNLQLIHGQADYHDLFKAIKPQPKREGNESGVVAETWFQNRKRALLSPFAVGTIDQVMLSVMQVRHHFVRQYALSQKIVLFDEIHSYDTYMNTIIERMLEWLVAMQSPMIMLSATLSKKNRLDILQAIQADLDGISDVPYPRLTIVNHNGQVDIHPLPRPETRMVNLKHIHSDVNMLHEMITSVYQKGGCIAIVCNTVNESISVARTLRDADGIDKHDVILFHARFPPIWRQSIEDHILNLFGKHSDERPQRMIIVATQIIEQSLDLDFDLMISSVAPIDLLIQRMGRLHRHDRQRSHHLADPTFIIRQPQADTDNIPNFGVDEFVYDRFILLKTWWIIQQMQDIHIPDDIDNVMDFVYSDTIEIPNAPILFNQALQMAYDDIHMENTRSRFVGSQSMISVPYDRKLIGQHNWQLSDDDHHNIATRQITPSIDIICIIDEHLAQLTTRRPSRDETLLLLKYRVAVRHIKTKDALESLPHVKTWEGIPQLRFARPIHFENEMFDIPNSNIRLQLTRIYGLEIIVEE